MGLWVFSLPISLMMIVRVRVLYVITIIKSEVWPTCHCYGLGHGTMVCAVCLFIFLTIQTGHLTFKISVIGGRFPPFSMLNKQRLKLRLILHFIRRKQQYLGWTKSRKNLGRGTSGLMMLTFNIEYVTPNFPILEQSCGLNHLLFKQSYWRVTKVLQWTSRYRLVYYCAQGRQHLAFPLAGHGGRHSYTQRTQGKIRKYNQ